MRLSKLTEITWRYYQNGEAKADKQQLTKADIKQQIKMLLGTLVRTRYIESKALDDFKTYDYTFIAPLLAVKRFKLTEADAVGKRVADLSGFDVYRLPSNNHITNIYPFAENCVGNQELGEITQVNVGEENFYANQPDFLHIKFFVTKKSRIETYNLPHCITHIDVEASFDEDDDTDVPLDMAYEISAQILGFTTKQKYAADQIALENELRKEQALKN